MLPSIDDLWDDEEETQHFHKVMLPFLLFGFVKGIENTAQKLKVEAILTIGKRATYYSKSLEYAVLSVGTTNEALKKQIDLAVTEGESVKQLAGRINGMYGESLGYKSLRIARTQLTETVNDGTTAALRAEGNRTKTWSTVIDGRERESHAAANDQTVGIDEFFKLAGGNGMFPGDSMFPISETANCRCTLVAGGTPDEVSRMMGELFLRTHSSLERKYVIHLRRAFISERDRVLSRLPS